MYMCVHLSDFELTMQPKITLKFSSSWFYIPSTWVTTVHCQAQILLLFYVYPLPIFLVQMAKIKSMEIGEIK